MPSILKHFSLLKPEPYEFPDTDEIIIPTTPEPSEEPLTHTAERKPSRSQNPIDYAKLQADAILQDARQEAEEILADAKRQAEEILSQTRDQAALEGEQIKISAREDGFREGYAHGMEQSMSEGAVKLQETAEAQGQQVEQFLERAGTRLDQFLDSSVDELRDLALAVAEKVVSVSLKSSGEVVARMIQTAVDKRKRREWVHIYISEHDAKRMAPIPASLSAALSALSDRVRIIPMANDEPGTCIIEMPNEIIDASASTQLNNLRSLLSETPSESLDSGQLL